MKKLKDILYDYNDILIAFAILAMAAALIVWRISAIVEYPRDFISDSSGGTEVSEPSGSENSGEGTSSSSSEGGSEQTQPADGSDTNSDSQNNDDSSSSNSSQELWVDGALSRDVDVTVSGDSATAAIQKLVEAGLFEDYAEYQSACDNLGIDHQKVSAGNFTFEKGSTKNDIARMVNWS